jgi:predicted HAD superfamily Cof-like phosphohydrolase
MPIGINVDKAKAIQKDKIREVRNPLLQAEDVTFMRAVEADDTDAKTASAARKQALRDATNIVDSATITATDVTGVTNELKVVWDADVLGENPLV